MQKTSLCKLILALTLTSIISPTLFAEDLPPETGELLEKRVAQEQKVKDNPFVITPHKANYILPITYSKNPNQSPFNELDFVDNDVIEHYEAKFQISFKMPLGEDLIKGNGDLYFAYTNQSWWQVYNKSVSAPFRETVHEPEVFLLFDNDFKLGPITNSFWRVGLNHQSNGQASTLSRSWNRIYGSMSLETDPMVFDIKAWWRFPEEKKSSASDATGDDNPDIRHYMGNMELTGLYGRGDHRLRVMVRNNMNLSDNAGAIEITYSYPMYRNIRFYSQYFNGYGESLIDYDAKIERIGVGIAINDIF